MNKVLRTICDSCRLESSPDWAKSESPRHASNCGQPKCKTVKTGAWENLTFACKVHCGS